MKQETKSELARIQGMLNNPLRTIKTNFEEMDRQLAAGKTSAYILGMYQGMTKQVLCDIEAIQEYISEQL